MQESGLEMRPQESGPQESVRTPCSVTFANTSRAETDCEKPAQHSVASALRRKARVSFTAVIALILALGLALQGAPGGRGAVAPGVVTGQILTRDGAPATAVRVAAIPAPPARAREG